jgi:simple sugar transport system ATP-binding protein
LRDVQALDDREHLALRGIDLDVHAGEILGLAGVSGNGQRELAQVITGLRAATQGTVCVADKDITAASPKARIETGISYIPEERMRDGMIKEFSVAENLILREHHQTPYSEQGFLNFKAIEDQSQTLIERFSVKTPSQETQAQKLSGGNIQKIILARELSRRPHIVIAAQPTRGLDIGASEYVRSQILEQRTDGAAILLISEDLDEILALSDRIAVIYEGQIMDILPAEEATAEQLGLLMAGVKSDAAEKAA